MFNIFKKKTEEISRITPGFEEEERKTPKVGLILLFIMFVAGMFFGWNALDDLARIPKAPEPLSNCSYAYENRNYSNITGFDRRAYYQQYYQYDSQNSSGCVFSQLEKEYRVADIFDKRIFIEKEIEPLQNNLYSVEGLLSENQEQLRQATGEYGVGVQEKIADIKSPIFPINRSGSDIVSLQNERQGLLTQKADLENKIGKSLDKLKIIDEEIKKAYIPVFEKQNGFLRWYEFKIFLLQFILIIPFFLLVFWGFLRLHRKNSPYTIIFTAIVAVASILLLKVILFWFWGLFLERILEVLTKWFAQYEIFRTLLFYLGMIISFVVFGGAVYWLQKKIFNPRRIAIRRFRAKQCSRCQTSLDLSVFYCPNCGTQIKSKCEKCGQARFIELPNCPYCGDKKTA